MLAKGEDRVGGGAVFGPHDGALIAIGGGVIGSEEQAELPSIMMIFLPCLILLISRRFDEIRIFFSQIFMAAHDHDASAFEDAIAFGIGFAKEDKADFAHVVVEARGRPFGSLSSS
jgi:hypothetical protein